MSQDLCILFVTKIPTKLPKLSQLSSNNELVKTLLTGASGEDENSFIINNHTFTNTNLLIEKTVITTNEKYEELLDIYQNNPYYNLVMFTILNIHNYLELDKNKLCCIILFKNNVYSVHYICTIDTIEEKKTHIIKCITKCITTETMEKQNYSALKINFNEDGSFKDSIDEPLNVVL
jgi:hypothetical protein